jgi:hypothetical protein
MRLLNNSIEVFLVQLSNEFDEYSMFQLLLRWLSLEMADASLVLRVKKYRSIVQQVTISYPIRNVSKCTDVVVAVKKHSFPVFLFIKCQSHSVRSVIERCLT